MNVTTRTKRVLPLIAMAALSITACGDRSSGPSPSLVTITGVKVGRGADKPTFASGPLTSDVVTKGTVFDDLAEVTMAVQLKDPGAPGIDSTPTPINSVTFTRYHVEYSRADGRNVQGLDVPFAFDGAQTFTVAQDGAAAVIEIVRHEAKFEAPLRALLNDSAVVITTIATVTFYGKDQAGNNVTTKADIQVNFSDFGDPED
jgi:hypothetical protein